MWLSDEIAKVLKGTQPKPAYKIYEEIMTKTDEDKKKEPRK
jgi:hypothetical protein